MPPPAPPRGVGQTLRELSEGPYAGSAKGHAPWNPACRTIHKIHHYFIPSGSYSCLQAWRRDACASIGIQQFFVSLRGKFIFFFPLCPMCHYLSRAVFLTGIFFVTSGNKHHGIRLRFKIARRLFLSVSSCLFVAQIFYPGFFVERSELNDVRSTPKL